MSKMNKIKNTALFVLGLFGIFQMQSCKEDIDMSDRYTFTEWTVSSYLAEHPATYSEYYNLLGKVRINDKYKSTVLQLMTARGNYTVFAPTNQAIHEYLDSLCRKGIITEPSWNGFTNAKTLDSIQKVIVYNSIIDGKDNTTAYQTSSFPDDKKEFDLPNMYDRKLTVHYDEINPDSVFINANKDDKTGQIIGGSLIDLKNRDIVAINGCIHCVHSVVAPSNATVGDILRDFVDLNDPNYSIIAELILACGLQDTLSQVKDEVYEQKFKDGKVDPIKSSGSIGTWSAPEHRKYGFTIFAETNAVWESKLGKSASDITLEDIKKWVINQGFYPDAKDNGNYADEDNVLNQFITYHILPMRLPVDKLVIHYNEKGYYYDPSSNPHTIPVWEIYTTMGKRRLLKLYEGNRTVEPRGGIYINRFPVLNNGRRENYYEKYCDDDKKGILINTAEAKNIINGYIYPINEVLVYDQATRNNFQKQRLRYDVAALFPEFMNNDIRANRINKDYTGLPCDKSATGYKYLEGLEIFEGSNFCYLPGIGYTWQNLQGDEFNVTGRYEMIFTLPPVPAKDIYEIRYAVQNNSGNRSMCQVYFGDNKDRMPAVGIPLDLRIGGDKPQLNWQQDSPTDDEVNAENDKTMRNNGFMKGAEGYHAGNASSPTARATQTTTRRIIVRKEMDPNKTYYLKFKSVLDKEDKEFYMDYIEFCAKAVYDNPETPEDIW